MIKITRKRTTKKEREIYDFLRKRIVMMDKSQNKRKENKTNIINKKEGLHEHVKMPHTSKKINK